MPLAADIERQTTSRIIASTIAGAMERDPRIVLIGEDIGELGGVFGATRQLHRTFGPDRVRNTPISETAFVGMAVGAAQAGLRPIVELMFVDFLGVCFDQIANQMAKTHFMSGGRVRVPLVLRAAAGCIGAAAQHSQVLSATFAHIPGLKVAFPSTPADAAWLLQLAIEDDNPVVFLEHKRLLMTKVGSLAYADDFEAPELLPPMGRLRTIREGKDVAIVSAGFCVQNAFSAASLLAEEGISAGVVDLRTLVPLDRDGLAAVASAAPAMLVVDDDYRDFGMSAEVIASITERLGGDSPRFARHALEVSVPANKALERAVLPSAQSIAQAARELLARV